MKSLEKDRTRRYEAASGLAEDVETFEVVNQCSRDRPPSRIALRSLAPKQSRCHIWTTAHDYPVAWRDWCNVDRFSLATGT